MIKVKYLIGDDEHIVRCEAQTLTPDWLVPAGDFMSFFTQGRSSILSIPRERVVSVTSEVRS